MSIKEMKKRALSKCSGNWKGLVGITFIYFLISGSASISYQCSILLLLGLGLVAIAAFSPAINFIYIKCLMLLRNNDEKVKYRNTSFNLSMLWNSIKFFLWLELFLLPAVVIYIIIIFISTISAIGSVSSIGYSSSYIQYSGIISFPWITVIAFIILIIYCIWLQLTYGFTLYLIAENKDCHNTRALMSKSAKLLKGHKWQFLLLELSFIGWGILAVFTLGIGCLWLTPYIKLTKLEFYYELKEKNNVDLSNNIE